MSSTAKANRYSAFAVGAALISFGVLSLAACGSNGGGSNPSTTTPATSTVTTTSSAPQISPTEKGLTPTGGNSFAPQVLAPPAPTEPPGVHRHR